MKRHVRESVELELAVAVRERREHEEAEPVFDRVVERREDARLVGVARAAQQKVLRLLASVAAEVRVKEIDHRPEVASLLDVDLEEVAQVVERRRGLSEETLLLDRRRLGVALRDDHPPESVAVLAGDLVPDGLPEVVAERDRPVRLLVGEEDAPAVLGHADVSELRPALAVHADRGAQVDVVGLEPLGAHLHPPVDELRLPALERAQELAVVGEVDVVGDLSGQVGVGHRLAPIRRS